jgi:hypothetical protein
VFKEQWSLNSCVHVSSSKVLCVNCKDIRAARKEYHRVGQRDELREPHLRRQRRQELHINKIKYISPCTTHFCSSNYNIISVSSDSPFFRRSFYNALTGQPRVHVNYLNGIFLQVTYMNRTIDAREPRFDHPSNITLKDVTTVNVCRKYILCP